MKNNFLLLLLLLLLVSCQFNNEDSFKIADEVNETVHTDSATDRGHELKLDVNQTTKLYNDSLYIQAQRFSEGGVKHLLLYVISEELGESRKFPAIDKGDVCLVDGYDKEIVGFKIEIIDRYYKEGSAYPTVDIRVSEFASM